MGKSPALPGGGGGKPIQGYLEAGNTTFLMNYAVLVLWPTSLSLWQDKEYHCQNSPINIYNPYSYHPSYHTTGEVRILAASENGPKAIYGEHMLRSV